MEDKNKRNKPKHVNAEFGRWTPNSPAPCDSVLKLPAIHGAKSSTVANSFSQKAVLSSNKMNLLQRQAELLEEKLLLESQSFQNQAAMSNTQLTQQASGVAVNITSSSAKVDRKRKRDKKQKKEKGAAALEKEIRMTREVAKVSRHRSVFNGNKDTLPAIGSKVAEVDFYVGKMPKIEKSSEICNDVIDVITKHEASVKTTAILKEIGHNFINSSAKLVRSETNNAAPEIIEKLESKVGRAYERYGGFPGYNYRKVDGSEVTYSRACSPAYSRSSSRTSRYGT